MATLAVVLGAVLVSALLNLSFDVGDQAGRELRAYGANVLLLPQGGATGQATPLLWGAVEGSQISEDGLAELDEVDGVLSYAPYLYLVAEVAGQPVVVTGTRFDRVQEVDRWWQIDGDWPRSPEEALIGVRAARALQLNRGDRTTLRYGERTLELTLIGIAVTGGPEDSQILVPLSVAQNLSGRPAEVGLVRVSVSGGDRSIGQVAASIESGVPGVEAQLVRRLTRAENVVLDRIRTLMALVAALVLTVATITVGGATATAVLERRTEIGLMTSLGAGRRRVAAFFLAEGLSMALAGGLVGYAGGLGLAAYIGRRVFETSVAPAPSGLPITLGVATAVVVLASLWPVRKALAVEPAMTLSGE